MTSGWTDFAYSPFQRLFVGDAVNSDSSVIYHCDDGFELDGPDTNYCLNGNWKENPPQCRPYCFLNHLTLLPFYTSNCSRHGINAKCSPRTRPGTIADTDCYIYSDSTEPATISQKSTCGKDGHWSPKPTSCLPACGQSQAWRNGTHSPWNVELECQLAIYTTTYHGTILSPRIIISYFGNNLYQYKASNWQAIVGGVHPTVDAYRAHTYDVESIRYNASNIKDDLDVGIGEKTDFLASIVLFVLKTPIEFHDGIAPLCLYPNGDYDLNAGTEGLIEVARKTRATDDVYFQNSLRIIPKSVCEQVVKSENSPEIWDQYSPFDVICIEKPTASNCSCRRGTGWVIPVDRNGHTTYYLGGVVKDIGPPMASIIEIEPYTQWIVSIMKEVERW